MRVMADEMTNAHVQKNASTRHDSRPLRRSAPVAVTRLRIDCICVSFLSFSEFDGLRSECVERARFDVDGLSGGDVLTLSAIVHELDRACLRNGVRTSVVRELHSG